MIKLRRVLRATQNFMYLVEFVEFLPHGKVRIFTDDVNCSCTEMRQLVDNHHFEVFMDHEWKICSESFYNEYVVNHKKVIRRRKAS